MRYFYSLGEMLPPFLEDAPLAHIFTETLSDLNSLGVSAFILTTMSGWLFSLYLIHRRKAKGKEGKRSYLELRCVEPQESNQTFNSHSTSCKAYKKFLTTLRARHREQAQYIHTSLDVVSTSLTNPGIKISVEERGEIIYSCLTVAKCLSNGFLTKAKNEPIILKKLLEKVQLIFAEKMLRLNIDLKVVCSEDGSFNGDSFFIEWILVILLGKIIYSTPKNEKIIIFLKKYEGALQLEIHGKRYTDTNKEKFIKHAFKHFIEDDIFQTVCQDNGLIYECFQANNGLSMTTLAIPITPSEKLSTNVLHCVRGRLLNDA